jgi:hypothetical protein
MLEVMAGLLPEWGMSCYSLPGGTSPLAERTGTPAERIELFTGTRAVLALDSTAVRVLVRLGYLVTVGSYRTS